MMVPALADGQTLSAVWDPNPPADAITNYEVCIGTTSLSCNFQQAITPASETSYTFTPTPGVLYRVAVRAVNAAGPGAYSPEVLVSTPGLTQPANQISTINVAISPLSLSASDPDGGSLQFTHSGLPFGLSLNQGTGIISGTPTSTGSFNVTVFVSDNTVTTSRSFLWTVQAPGSTDTTAPTLAITSHTAGQTINASTITLAGTASDSGTGGNGISSVTVNGASTGAAASGSNTANWSRSINLSIGANLLTVVATDGVGNVRTSTVSLTRVSVDTTIPSLTITSHSSGQTLTTSTVTLAGTASDNGAGGSGIARVTVNGTATGATASGNGTANWNRSVTLAAGANVLTVVATDGAGNARTTPITLVGPVAAMTSTSMVPNRNSPQVAGTAITFTGSSAGGTAPYSYKWWVQANGGAWVMLQNWSTTTTFTWTPSAPGTYTIGLWTRGAGLTADLPQITSQLSFVVTAASGPPPPPPSVSMTGTSMVSNRTSPQNAGTAVTFTASGTGGTAPYSYKWWVQANGGAWVMLRDWSTSTTFAWTPSVAGTYMIGLWARSSGLTTDLPQTTSQQGFVVTGSASPPPPPAPGTAMSSASVTSNMSSPRTPGTTVTFTASGSGGTAPYSFKWWVQKDGGAWTMLQNWSTSTTFAWSPSQNGNYVIGVWGRSAGATADAAQAIGTATFAVVLSASAPPPPSPPPPPPPSAGPMTGSSVVSNRGGPQPVGGSFTFTVSGTGGTAPYSYKWWVQKDGGAWTMLRDWSTSSTYTAAPSEPGIYVIGVWGRSAGATADAPQTIATTTALVAP